MKNPLLKSSTKIFKHEEAYCMIKYKGSGKTEVIWNGRDGEVPTIIYSKDGTQQLSRVKFDKIVRRRNHILQDKELYFANTTKARAKFLAKKIVYNRWNNTRYPLCQQYGSKKEAIFLIYKSFYGDGNNFTILKKGRNITTYMTRHFKRFISAT